MVVSLSVRNIIRPIVSLDRDSNTRDGANKMMEENIGSIVVSDSGNYVGIVTERDMVKKVIALGKDPSKTTLGEIMTSPLVTIEADRGLGEATSLMLQRGIRRLVAVDKGKIFGILLRDLQQKVDEVFWSLAEVQQLE